MPGPVPNRSGNLSRERDAHRGGKEITKGVMRPVDIPEAPSTWDPVAQMVWESMRASGISDFYQQTDWAYAYVVLSELSAYRTPGFNKETGEDYPTHRPSGNMFAAIMSAMTSLGLAEGDRRRMRIELENPPTDQAVVAVVAIDKYRNRLGAAKVKGGDDHPHDDRDPFDQEHDRLPDPSHSGSGD